MSSWLRYHNYCMREAFSHDDTFHKILAIALWWVILVRFTHTNRIRPKQFQEEKE
nr:MAG TPA: hypothetical protein [Caudoviricetes sp.]